ncbi:MAG TPA: mechanosensitive ion channel family protein [Vicinamibacterales bacterium]|nr:mechanosensitive ion channel family protein [Vicinamibacterales bacterium]
MNAFLDQWPIWVSRLVWTVITLALAFVVGITIRVFLAARLVRLATKTRRDWDDVLAVEVKRRIPFWSLLVGLWISLDYWPLQPRWATLLSRTISTFAIASVTLLVAAVATRFVATYGPRVTPSVPVSGLTQNLVRFLVVTVGLLAILNGLDVDVRPALAALGVGGLAVALALQEPLSNLFAGLFVTLAGQVRIGDYVRLESGAEGFIRDFNWRSARLQTMAGHYIIVPNSKLAQAIVSNFSLPTRDIQVTVDVGVDYGSDLAKVEQIATTVANEVIRDVAGSVPDSPPAIRYHTFSDLSVKFSVNVRAREFADQFLIKHELVKRLHARLAHEGVVLRPPTPVAPR